MVFPRRTASCWEECSPASGRSPTSRDSRSLRGPTKMIVRLVLGFTTTKMGLRSGLASTTTVDCVAVLGPIPTQTRHHSRKAVTSRIPKTAHGRSMARMVRSSVKVSSTQASCQAIGAFATQAASRVRKVPTIAVVELVSGNFGMRKARVASKTLAARWVCRLFVKFGQAQRNCSALV